MSEALPSFSIRVQFAMPSQGVGDVIATVRNIKGGHTREKNDAVSTYH